MQPEGAAPWDARAAAATGARHAAPSARASRSTDDGHRSARGDPGHANRRHASKPAHDGRAALAAQMGQGQMMMMPQNPPKQLLVGVLLAPLLGVFGVHNHLGHTGRGVAQLLITVLTLGLGSIITWIWSLIELIMMATGSLHDADGRPLV